MLILFLYLLLFSSVDSLCGSRALSSAATTASFQQDLGLRMLVCGRRDIIQQALAMLGPEKVNTINIQVGINETHWDKLSTISETKARKT